MNRNKKVTVIVIFFISVQIERTDKLYLCGKL